MFEKWKNILTVGLLSAFVLGFGIWAAVKPADALSTSERRPLAQMPELSASSYLSGKFMSGYEDYATHPESPDGAVCVRTEGQQRRLSGRRLRRQAGISPE